jgi:hypothetical protein
VNEGDVFSAVIAVSELAHRLFIEGARAGDVELAIVRRGHVLRLEARAGRDGSAASSRVSLAFPPAPSPLCS